MSGAPPAELRARLATLRRALRLRAVLIVSVALLPWMAVATLLAWRFAGARAALATALACLAGGLVLARRRAVALDAAWLARRLNAAAPALEDSAELALAAAGPPASGLAELQQARVQRRLVELSLPDLRPPWPWRLLAAAWMVAALVLGLAFTAPLLLSCPARRAGEPATTPAAATAVRRARLTIEPPAYTGLPVRDIEALNGQAPAASRIHWAMQLDRAAAAVALVFHDGARLALRADGGFWRGARRLDASSLYRIELEGAPPVAGDPLYRLEAIPDRAPEVKVRAPAQTLNVITEARAVWELAFDASDDYGLADARLAISLAQGSGEQIAVTTREHLLDGGRDRHRRRYRESLDLAALGFAEGDDLIVRLTVADNRAPEPNVTASASYILRWRPAPAGDGTGLEGVVQKVMPAYFRSQRQLIIDTEGLIAERERLDAARFSDRADALGVDQKFLRLRYGQFLGEEFEGAGQAERDEEARPGVPASGGAEAVASEYGHLHDLPEAATLLDAQTKRILRLALNEMWQAELHLRLAAPERALPYEHKALEYIKQAQQAERVYLARVGLALPQVDEARRLSGERADSGDRALPVRNGAAAESPPALAGAALAGGAEVDLAALQSWAQRHEAQLPDALALLAAIDRWRREPGCAECRTELGARLWPLVPAPAPGVLPRPEPDAAGAAYLDALARMSR